MAIAPLIVRVRALGAAALTNLSINFRRLAANVRSAYARFVTAGGLAGFLSRRFQNLAQNTRQAARAMAQFAAASALAGLSRMLTGLGNGIANMAAASALLSVKAAALTAAVLPLVGILGNLLPLLALSAPAALVAVAGLGALAFAFHGVGDALRAAGDPEEFAKQLKKLTPAARSAVMTLVDLGREWSKTKKIVQESFFTGFREDAIAVSRALQPIAEKWLPKIAGSFRDLRTYIAEGLAKFAADGRLEGVMRNISLTIDNITRGIGSLAKGFGAALVAAAPFLEKLSSGFATAMEKFATWLDENSKNGNLSKWIQQGIDTVEKLGRVAGNVAGIVRGLFTGSSDGADSTLDQIVQLTEKMETFVKSADGQSVIKFFSSIAAAISSTEPAWQLMFGQIRFATDLFGWLADAAAFAWDWIKTQALLATIAIVGQLGLIVTAAAAAFGWIPGVGDKLKDAKAAFDRFVDGVKDELAKIPRNIPVTVTIERKYIGGTLGGAGGYRGFAGGTSSAPRGWAMVGERGPELVMFGGGERVLTASATRRAMAGGSGAGLAPAGGGVAIVMQASTNANNRLVSEIVRAIRVDIRKTARGSSSRYWETSGRG